MDATYISCNICLLLLDFWLCIVILIRSPSEISVLREVTQKLKLRGSTFSSVMVLSYQFLNSLINFRRFIPQSSWFSWFRVHMRVQTKQSAYLLNRHLQHTYLLDIYCCPGGIETTHQYTLQKQSYYIFNSFNCITLWTTFHIKEIFNCTILESWFWFSPYLMQKNTKIPNA